MKNWLLLILILIAVSGCAFQETKGKEICVKIKYDIKIEGDGNLTFSPSSVLDTLSGNLAQDADSDLQQPLDIEPKIPLGSDPSSLLDNANSLLSN